MSVSVVCLRSIVVKGKGVWPMKPIHNYIMTVILCVTVQTFSLGNNSSI